jgi:hypothetical protein
MDLEFCSQLAISYSLVSGCLPQTFNIDSPVFFLIKFAPFDSSSTISFPQMCVHCWAETCVVFRTELHNLKKLFMSYSLIILTRMPTEPSWALIKILSA